MKKKLLFFPFLAVFLFFYLNLFANALIDDSFITLRYVKTLLTSGTWGFNPGYVANAVTSPLNIILLAFTGLFLGPTVNAVIFMAVINLMVIVILLARISRHLFETEFFGYLAASALILNPLIISTLGLESMLFANIYILSLYLFVTNKWLPLSIALGLLTITRFDGFLFFLVILPLISALKLRLKFAAIYILCIIPWHIFSWMHLGSFFPDSLLIKISQTPQNLSFFNGLTMYLTRYPLETILSFLFLPFIFLLFNKQIRAASFTSFLALTSLAHFTGYSLLRVFPYHWYYITETTSIILLTSLGLGVLYKNGVSEIFQRVRSLYIAVIIIIFQTSGMFYILAKDGFLIKEMPIHSNWATHEQYKEVGEWLKKNKGGSVVMVYNTNNIGSEVGTIGYYCDCTLLNMFSDRTQIRQYANEQSIGKGLRPLLHRLNFLFLDKNITSPEPAYLLLETPGGTNEKTASIIIWETTTKWMSRCSIKLSNYASIGISVIPPDMGIVSGKTQFLRLHTIRSQQFPENRNY